MSIGKVSLVGVGPGDPELLTRKAERVLREADLVYHPGRCVAFITEGDPLVYSTASRLLVVLQTQWPEVAIEIVPGVTSLTAAAAVAGRSLVQADETL